MKHLSTSPETNDQSGEYSQLPTMLRQEIKEVIDWGQNAIEGFDAVKHAEMPVLKAWEAVKNIYQNEELGTENDLGSGAAKYVLSIDHLWFSEIMPDGKNVDPVKLQQTIRVFSNIDVSTLPDYERVAPVVFSAFSRFLVDTYPEGPGKIEDKHFG